MRKTIRTLFIVNILLLMLAGVACSTLFSPAQPATTVPSTPEVQSPAATNPTPPVIQFSVSPEGILPKNSAILSWNVTNATTVVIDNGIGPVALSGTMPVSPDVSTTYTLTAANATATVSSQTILIVTPVSGPPSPPGGPLPPVDKDWVGSRNTNEYHFPSCIIAQKIPLPSKVWFDTVAQARAAGFNPCVVCKPPR